MQLKTPAVDTKPSSALFGPEGLFDQMITVTQRDTSASVIFESAGGGRNTDYDQALEAVLNRAFADGWSLEAVYLRSRTVDHLTEAERQIELDSPLDLSDARSARRAIQSAVALAHRIPEAAGGGNPQKRIELVFTNADPDADLELTVAPYPQEEPPPPTYWVNTQITVTEGKIRSPNKRELEKAWQLHNQTQMLLVDRIHAHPRFQTVAVAGANVDVTWRQEGLPGITIAEIKSLSSTNETAQIRFAIGEILHFAEIALEQNEEVDKVIFIPRPLNNDVFARVCVRAGIELCWPGNWPEGLG